MSQAAPVVRRMVMFKHGVAYLERGGPCDGSFEMSFKRDEMNDVLKSLAVWVAAGEASVGAVAFEKPEDPEEALVRRRLSFTPGQALGSLLATLRGRKVAVDAQGARTEGEVIGFEHTRGPEQADRKVLILRRPDESLAMVDLATLRAIDLLEAPSRADLAFLVDRSRAATAGESRTINVDVRGRADDLRVSYVIPAPTWRVSYRLARGEGETAKTVLMAWAIVHNPADEDLTDIALTLTTGQPVSFVIDLYNPKNIRRAVVEEQTRAAAAPTRFERAPQVHLAAPRPAAMAPLMEMDQMRSVGASAYAHEDEEAPPTPGLMLGASGAGAATFEDRGELFEYKVATKVSLKRGGSAMVPLFSSELDAGKERIWRDGSGPSPDLLLSFKNETGAVLEEGAAVVYDGAVYAGEAMVPYSARGTEVKLAFAKDLGVRCKRDVQDRRVVDGLHLRERTYIEDIRQEIHHLVTAESDHAEPVKLVVELPKVHGREFDPAYAQPFEDTSSFHRFKVEIEPRGRVTLTIVERWLESRKMNYEQLDMRKLQGWLADRFLDQPTFDGLSGVLRALEEAGVLEQRRNDNERAKQAAWAKQAKLSEQLKVLRDGGPEGELRLRYVKELEAEQNKVNAAEVEDRRLWEAAEAARKRARELVLSLAKA
jgi:hypothetical protein